jgi:hypothetical protein
LENLEVDAVGTFSIFENFPEHSKLKRIKERISRQQSVYVHIIDDNIFVVIDNAREQLKIL